jgi:antitoxin HicB
MKSCKLNYPVKLTRTSPSTVMAEFRDVPGAMTEAATEEAALYWAQDALLVMLSGVMDQRRPIPMPSRPKHGEKLVEVPPMPAMKLAIYQAMLETQVTQAALSEKMGIDARQVRRILDLDHNTRLDYLIRALQCLGKRLTVEIADVA